MPVLFFFINKTKKICSKLNKIHEFSRFRRFMLDLAILFDAIVRTTIRQQIILFIYLIVLYNGLILISSWCFPIFISLYYPTHINLTSFGLILISSWCFSLLYLSHHPQQRFYIYLTSSVHRTVQGEKRKQIRTLIKRKEGSL